MKFEVIELKNHFQFLGDDGRKQLFTISFNDF